MPHSFPVLTRVKSLLILVLCLCSSLLPLQAHSAASDYYPHILIKGKLQRFNDATRVIYYKVDALENSPQWDYTKWNFYKDQMVREAFDEWERALNGHISFSPTNNPMQVDIAVHWRNGFGSTSLLGLERPNYGDGKHLTDADIQLTLTSGGRLLSDKEIKAIAIHEIGHALGMNGHSPYPGDLMYPAIQPGVYKLSSRDVRTMQVIYSQKPDITNPAGIHLAQYRESFAYFQSGMEAFNRKQYPKASQNFAAASKYNPQEPAFSMMAGLSAYKQNNLSQARTFLEKAASQPHENQLGAQLYLAECMMRQGQAALQQGNKAQAAQLFKTSSNYYATLLKNPKTPQDARKVASANLNWINKSMKP